MITRMIPVLVLLALLVGGMGLLPRLAAQEEKPKPVEATLKTVDGKTLKLADYRGKVVLVDVWATWCPPCRREIPEMVELQKEITKEKLDIVIIGMAIDKDPAVLPKFIKANKINYPIVLRDNKVIAALGEMEYIPTKFVIDRAGIVRETLVGGMVKTDLKKKLKTYLAEKAK